VLFSDRRVLRGRQVLDKQRLMSRDLDYFRSDMKDLVRNLKDRYDRMDENYTSTKLEILQLEEKLNNNSRQSRQKFDTVKRAFKVGENHVHTVSQESELYAHVTDFC
jgi:hypothetical protein